MRKIVFAVIVVLVGCTSVTQAPHVRKHSTDQVAHHIDHILCLYSCPLGADPNNFLVDNEIYLLLDDPSLKA